MEPMEKKDQRTPNQGEGAVPSSPRKKRILLCCLAAAVLVIGYTALCAGAGRETIYPNVTVNGVNLGGLTQEAAQTALEEAGGPGRPAGDAENQGVVFTAQTVEGESKTYQVPLASVTPDSVASTQRAWQVGHADPFPLRGGIYLRCLLSGEEVLPAYQGGESLDSILDQVEADLARDPVEPTWETDDTTLHLTRGTPGSRLDREALQGQILDTLGRSDMVELTAEAQPQFTVTLQQTLPGELDLADILSQVETPVQNAAFDKAAKIFQTDHPGISFDAAAAQTAYDGLDWGATQDFPLDITQPTTTYVGGETVQETGGGVCQGSSTVYLAALRANLKIVERYPHGYITRYVPDGMDATVYYGAKDFRFQNDTPFPLKVVASVSGRTLTVNILGTKSDNITVEMTNQVVGTTPYKTVYQVDESLPAGTTKVKTTPYTGYTVKVYRNLYENGALKDTKLESTSVYRPRDQVILVSPDDAAQYGL